MLHHDRNCRANGTVVKDGVCVPHDLESGFRVNRKFDIVAVDCEFEGRDHFGKMSFKGTGIRYAFQDGQEGR